MTFAVKDKSVHDGAPIECYEFIATHYTWRFTSYDRRINVAGAWYEPLPITRTAIEIASILDSAASMDFIIPSDHEIARQFCYTVSPKNLMVIVRKVHEGDNYATDFKIEWTGRISGSSAAGKWATIKTDSIIKTELNGFLSSVYYQKSCNHVLYDVRCKANRADFTVEAQVTKIQSQIITVDNMVYGADELVGGVMTNKRNGETQGIISNNNNIIRIGYPFFDLVFGDVVELTLGCDHQRLGHCQSRFNNVANYGGMDFIPEINPFEKLVYSSQTSTEVTAKGKVTRKPPQPVAQSARYTKAKTTWGTSVGFTFKPKPKPTSNRSTNFENSTSVGTGSVPQSFLGMPVPAVLGQKRVVNNNLLWTGNLTPITETIVSKKSWKETVDHGDWTEEITHTETTTTVSIVGYFVDLHLGVCLGPDVHLVGIYIDNEKVWEGDVGPSRTLINLPKNETFLSQSKVYFSGGQYNQAPEPLIDVPDYPGYVGIATVYIENVRADIQMGTIGFEVVRVPNPLGVSNAVNREVNDLNTASAIVEVMTNEWGWGGLDISHIDIPNFSASAAKLADEGNFASLKIDNEVGISDVLSTLQDQANMIMYENPETALIVSKLVRLDNFDFLNMPRVYVANTSDVRNFQKTGWKDTIEQARALYPERNAEYLEMPVFMQNAANISQSGRGRKTVTISYPFVPNKVLALNLLARDMRVLAAPTYSFSVLMNRDGAVVFPGDIVAVSWPDYGLLNLPMQIMSVRKQALDTNNVVLTLKQAKYPDTNPLFGTGGPTYDPGFDTNPKTPTGLTVVTAPYFMARIQNGISSSDANPINFPMFFPRPANDFQASFTPYIRNLPGAGTLELTDGAAYSTYGLLSNPISKFDGYANGLISSMTIYGIINPAYLVSIGESGIRNGRGFLFINNEIMGFETATDNGDGTWTLGNVRRALLDTVHQDHSADAAINIIGNNFSMVSEEGFAYPVGYTPNWTVVSNSIMKQGLIDNGYNSNAWTLNGMRTLSPPRPHDVRVSGTRSETPVNVTEGNNVTVTWRTRSRVRSTVALFADTADAPETRGPNTQMHRIYHRSSTGTYTELGAGPYSGNSATFVMPNVANGNGHFIVEAEMVLGGLTYFSLYEDRVPVNIISAP